MTRAKLGLGCAGACFFFACSPTATSPHGYPAEGGVTGGSGGLAVGGTGGTGQGGSGGSGGGSFGGFGGSGNAANGGTGGGTGGAPSGGGGTGNVGGSVNITPDNMIDDMESGTGSIKPQNGRIGAWYTYNDETAAGSQTPLMGSAFLPEATTGGPSGSLHAAHTYGSGFATWGAGMGFDLNNDGATKKVYDVTGKTGFAFWGKGGHPVRVKVLTSGTTPVAEGGTCSTNCGDNHGLILTFTGSWQQFVVPFTSLVQEGWGAKIAFAPNTVIGIQFQVTANVAFDYWVDDIGFY